MEIQLGVRGSPVPHEHLDMIECQLKRVSMSMGLYPPTAAMGIVLDMVPVAKYRQNIVTLQYVY